MESWLLVGTWSLGRERHSDFRKKIKRENDPKVQEREKWKLSGGNRRKKEHLELFKLYNFEIQTSQLQ